MINVGFLNIIDSTWWIVSRKPVNFVKNGPRWVLKYINLRLVVHLFNLNRTFMPLLLRLSFASLYFFQVIVLQSYFRRWQARNVVAELKMDRDRRLEWERQEEIRKRREKEGRIRKEFERRMNPKSKEDFDLLYAALESKWNERKNVFHFL